MRPLPPLLAHSAALVSRSVANVSCDSAVGMHAPRLTLLVGCVLMRLGLLPVRKRSASGPQIAVTATMDTIYRQRDQVTGLRFHASAREIRRLQHTLPKISIYVMRMNLIVSGLWALVRQRGSTGGRAARVNNTWRAGAGVMRSPCACPPRAHRGGGTVFCVACVQQRPLPCPCHQLGPPAH